MKDLDDSNPSDPDDKIKGNKKPMAAAKYKAMKKAPGQDLAADPSKAPSPTNPIMVEKADGTIGRWGKDLPTQPQQVPVKKSIGLSDKAQGYDNNYIPARDRPSGPSPETIKPSYKYRY